MARCQFNDLLAPGVEEWIGFDPDGGNTLLDERGEGGLEFSFAAGFGDVQLEPERAAASTSFICGSAVGRPGLNRPPITRACGISSRSNSSRFATTSRMKSITPVILPPGRLRLATRPSRTGSDPTTKTIGIVEDAAFIEHDIAAFGAECYAHCVRENVDPAHHFVTGIDREFHFLGSHVVLLML